MDIAAIRTEYQLMTLDEADVESSPMEQFYQWWQHATNSRLEEPNAMTLATASASGVPSARIVLLKNITSEGLVFFTNYQSAKGKELIENPHAALVFFWKELQRQVRFSGTVKKISPQDSDNYFSSRPATSRIGAWSSPQSRVIASRAILEENEKMFTAKFGETIPRPEYWGGFIVIPETVEFWQGRPSRLHDRIQYSLKNGAWQIERLAP